MFVKAGAILPLAPPLKNTKAFDGSHTLLAIFPGADGRFTLYEDDGTTDAYQRGEYETTFITQSTLDDDTIAISICEI